MENVESPDQAAPETKGQPNEQEKSKDSSIEQTFDKFEGKDREEVIKAYQNLEKLLGKKESEKQEKLTEYQTKVEELNNRLTEVNQSTQYQQSPQKSSYSYSEEEFEKELVENPASAIKKFVSNKEQNLKQKLDQQSFSYNMGVLATQPDYSQVATTLNKLLKFNSDLVHPEKVSDPRVANLLYFAARGLELDNIVKQQAAAKASQQKQVENEKRAAASSSSMSESSSEGSFSDEEILRLLETNKISADKAKEMILKSAHSSE